MYGTRPPSVRLVLLALAAPPVLVPHLSARCPPCVRLLSALLCWPRLQFLCHLSALCLPCVVGFGRASSPCPPCVVGSGRAYSSCPPLVRRLFPKQFTVGFSLRRKKVGRHMRWPRPRSLPVMWTPPNLVRDLSAMWPPANVNVSALSRLRLQTLSTMCPPCARLLSCAGFESA